MLSVRSLNPRAALRAWALGPGILCPGSLLHRISVEMCIRDSISVTVLAVLAGGPIGVFTVIAAFFTGPLITAWNRFATLPLYLSLIPI